MSNFNVKPYPEWRLLPFLITKSLMGTKSFPQKRIFDDRITNIGNATSKCKTSLLDRSKFYPYEVKKSQNRYKIWTMGHVSHSNKIIKSILRNHN